LFADETKFSINNGDLEDAIFYMGITAPKKQIGAIAGELKEILSRHRYQGSCFHATRAFSEKRPRFYLMNDLTELFIRYRLHCFCYRYSKKDLFEVTQLLKGFNNTIINFDNQEFQALYYFLMFLNTHLMDSQPANFGKQFIMYFDRNVYGTTDTEGFEFPDERFVIKRMTFVEKSAISLLALPDFFGYLFRKSKISTDRAKVENTDIEKSILTINCYTFLLKLSEAKLFHFLNIRDESAVIRQMFNL
jgi:hypothetical protein